MARETTCYVKERNTRFCGFLHRSNQRPRHCAWLFIQEAQFHNPEDGVFGPEARPNDAVEGLYEPEIQRRSKGRAAPHSQRESCGYRFGDD